LKLELELLVYDDSRKKVEIEKLRKENKQVEFEKQKIVHMVQQEHKAKEDIMIIISDLKEKIKKLEKKSES